MARTSHCQRFFLEEAMNNAVEAGPPFEFLDSEYSESGTPLSCDGSKTWFRDDYDSEGSVIGPRSILRIPIERKDIPWCNIRFGSKAQRHQLFNK